MAEEEYSRAQKLRAAQRDSDTTTPNGQVGKIQEVPLIEAGVLAGFLFFFFDLPVYILYFFWITIPFGFTWWIMGASIVVLWLALKGRLSFSAITQGWWILLISTALFVLYTASKSKTEKLLAHIPGGSLASKAISEV